MWGGWEQTFSCILRLGPTPSLYPRTEVVVGPGLTLLPGIGVIIGQELTFPRSLGLGGLWGWNQPPPCTLGPGLTLSCTPALGQSWDRDQSRARTNSLPTS